MNPLSKTGLAGALVMAVCLLVATPSRAGVIYDNFNDNILNTNLWSEVLIMGAGPTVAETNQRLEITIPADASPGNYGLGGMVGAKLNSDGFVRGNFDVQFDFNLLTWPTPNGTNVGIVIFNDLSQCQVERASFGPDEPGGPREVYAIFSPTNYFEVVTTPFDISGKLRMVRTEEKIEGFYWFNNGWQIIGSIEDPNFGTLGELYLTSTKAQYAYGYGLAVKVAIDNFRATNGFIGNTRSGALDVLLGE